jgi:hypothetical protein
MNLDKKVFRERIARIFDCAVIGSPKFNNTLFDSIFTPSDSVSVDVVANCIKYVLPKFILTNFIQSFW